MSEIIPAVTLTRVPDDDPRAYRVDGIETYRVRGFVPALGKNAELFVGFTKLFVATVGIEQLTDHARAQIANWVKIQPEWRAMEKSTVKGIPA